MGPGSVSSSPRFSKPQNGRRGPSSVAGNRAVAGINLFRNK